MRAPLSDLPLVLENVSLRAGATPILDGLNLTVAPGAPTLIVGPNGAGKTSLLRLCMRRNSIQRHPYPFQLSQKYR